MRGYIDDRNHNRSCRAIGNRIRPDSWCPVTQNISTAPAPRLSVMMVIPSPCADLGGVGNQVLDLAVQLVREHRIKVVIAATASDDAAVSKTEEICAGVDGLHVRWLPEIGKVSNAGFRMGWTRRLQQIARDENIDLVNAYASAPFVAEIVARSCPELPLVLTYHRVSARTGKWGIVVGGRAYERCVLANTMRRADALIFASRQASDRFARAVAPIREIIPPASDLVRPVSSEATLESQARRTLNVYEQVLHWRDPRTLRVAVVAPHYHPRIGGLEKYAQKVVQALHDSPRHEVVVLCTNESHRTVVESQGGVTVVRLPTLLTLSNTPLHPLWPILLRRLFRRLSIDVIHAHAPVPGFADVATFVAGRRPVALTYHTGSLLKGVRWLDIFLSLYEKHLLPRVFNRCAALGAVSPVSKCYETGRAVLLPPGVDTTAFSPAPDRQRRDSTVLYVGRIDRTWRLKGLDVLFRAMALLRFEMPEVRLNMVGTGDAVPLLQRLARQLGIDDIVRWSGALDGRELVEEFRRAGVVVLPSTTESESFGMVLIEAMACGRPVIGSDVGGIPFVIRPKIDGLLVPPGDPKALADACLSVLLDPELAEKLGTEGRRRAEERWEWSKRLVPIIDVLDGTLKEWPPKDYRVVETSSGATWQGVEGKSASSMTEPVREIGAQAACGKVFDLAMTRINVNRISRFEIIL